MSDPSEKISAAELEVMEVLWQAGEPLPLTPIRQELERTRGWNTSTVKTLLRRLCEKEAVLCEKREMLYYSPLLSRREYGRWSLRNLLHGVFRGSAMELVACLAEEESLSDNDARELRAILDGKEGESHD